MNKEKIKQSVLPVGAEVLIIGDEAVPEVNGKIGIVEEVITAPLDSTPDNDFSIYCVRIPAIEGRKDYPYCRDDLVHVKMALVA